VAGGIRARLPRAAPFPLSPCPHISPALTPLDGGMGCEIVAKRVVSRAWLLSPLAMIFPVSGPGEGPAVPGSIGPITMIDARISRQNQASKRLRSYLRLHAKESERRWTASSSPYAPDLQNALTKEDRPRGTGLRGTGQGGSQSIEDAVIRSPSADPPGSRRSRRKDSRTRSSQMP